MRAHLKTLLFVILFLVFCLAGNICAVDPNTDLIGYWDFEGSEPTLRSDCDGDYWPCEDVNLILYGGAYWEWDFDRDSNVLVTDGINDWGLVSPDDDFEDITGADGITVMTFLKSDDIGSGDVAVGKGYAWRLRGGWTSDGDVGKLTFQCMDVLSGITTDDRWDDGNWHDVAATYDGSNYRIYVDGVEAATAVAATGAISGELSYDVAVGAHYNHNDPDDPRRFFMGRFDEICVFKRALTLQEIIDFRRGDPNIPILLTPRNRSRDAMPYVVLGWQSGDSANDVNGQQVYFGTSYLDVRDATINTAGIYKGAQSGTSYDPLELLDPNITLYWRVDNVNDSVSPYIWESEIFEFTTTNGEAGNPSPWDGKANVSGDVVLSWTAGAYVNDVNGHDVYFGTAESPPLVKTQSGTTYDPPGLLEMDETYYWKIVEVNDGPYSNAESDVWSFTVRDYIVIDDFEGYHGSDTELRSVWACSDNGYNYLSTDPEPFHEDGNSMVVDYGNDGTSPYYSTVERTFSSGQDWTADGVTALTLFFHGLQITVQHPANDDEDLFIRLTDDDGTPHSWTVQWDGDPCALSTEFVDGGWDDQWYEWKIPLADFTGVTLTNIKKIEIIVGDGSSPGGDGEIYIDDIRLYIPSCYPNEAAGDFTGDCKSDYDDFERLAEEWLEQDNLETDFNGVLSIDFPTNGSQWVTGYDGSALQFDGMDDWMDISDGLLSDFQDKTIAMWVRLDASDANVNDAYIFGSSHYKQRLNIFFGGSASDVSGVVTDKLYYQLAGTNEGGDVISAPAESSSTVSVGTWTHVAATVWNRSDGKARGELFINGWPIEMTVVATPRLVGPLVGACLGAYDDGSSHMGDMTIDDLRIYDSVLADADVLAVKNDTYAGDKWVWYKLDNADANDLIAVESGVAGKSYYTELTANSEIYAGEAIGSRYVNFRDYAYMASNWLGGEDLWP